MIVKKVNKILDNVDLIEIKTEFLEITLMNHGARIYSLYMPDKSGNKENVVLTLKDTNKYFEYLNHLNATIGPTSGRIEGATFKIDDNIYRLDKNDNDNNLHGGNEALSNRVFDYKIENFKDKVKVFFSLFKPEKIPGFPGNQNYRVTYTIFSDEIRIDYYADTDKNTLVNLTNHTYFNLSGNLKRDILEQELFINATNMMDVDKYFIPSEKQNIIDTPYDFKEMHKIKSEKIIEIDNPYLLDDKNNKIIQASLFDRDSGRLLDVYTTYSTIVCYTQNFPINEEYVQGLNQDKYMGVCFEAQKHPNGINMNGFETSILKKDEIYQETTRFVFSVKN